MKNLLIFTLFLISDALGEERITVSPGETATFSCIYQGESIHHPKFFCKWDHHSCTEVIRTLDSPRGRFSITEDHRRSRVTVRISDVREEDGGVYYCGGWKDSGMESEGRITVNMLHLRVTGRKTPPVKPTTTKIPTAETSRRPSTQTPAPTTSEEPRSGLSVVFILIIIITVCVTLLLIGGFSTFFYILGRNRALNSAPTSRQRGINNTADYENDSPRNRHINLGPIYHNLNPNINQSDHFYHNLNPNINQSDHVYQSLNPNTNQSDHVYQSLNPNTNQSDHVYQSLNPNTNQSDSVYQTLNPNTNQSDSVCQTGGHRFNTFHHMVLNLMEM
ncbi:hypothetical protein AMEX_G24686 [Astyanax mexicanus]|uniref:Ig-like domain-containing protein n=1 Tax=Astyanax mexicanus TaxID=7994 RepID=A0A8T2KU00_ASTMX|nr:hypothetical protein AMEX_G24686 [Astyanax mexicanus]